MQHLRKGRKFKRVRSQRKALHKALLGNFILHEKMQTTEAKAKEVKILIDRIINKAKKIQDPEKKVAVIRDLRTNLSAVVVKKLSGDFTNRFSGRTSGYARVIKLAPRKSDNARMAMIEFVDQPQHHKGV